MLLRKIPPGQTNGTLQSDYNKKSTNNARIGYKYHTILGQLAISHFKRNLFNRSAESAVFLYLLRFSCLIVSSYYRCLYFNSDYLATD